MGTLQITAAGFANLPATAPSLWPSNLTYPTSGATNGSKTYTISDADWIRLVTWAANANNLQLVNGSSNPPPAPPPHTVTGVQVLLSLVQNWINGMIGAEQQFGTTPPQPPTPVVIQ